MDQQLSLINTNINISLLDDKKVLEYMKHIAYSNNIDHLDSFEDIYTLSIVEQQFIKWGLQKYGLLFKTLKYQQNEIEKYKQEAAEIQRKSLLKMSDEEAARKLQRVWRGHKGRRQFYELLVKLSNMEIIVPKIDF